MSTPVAVPDAEELTDLSAAPIEPWQVVVWNDPVNLMSYVVRVFRTYFGYSQERATQLMLAVHNEGHAVVATGPRETMEVHAQAMHDYGLWGDGAEGVAMTPTVTVRMTEIEGAQLRHLVRDFRALLSETDGTPDPALDRLTPSAYPDDGAAAEEFRSTTRDALLERRARDAERVEHSLSPVSDDAVAEDPLSEFDLELTGDDAEAWLRTLTAVRLVIADRLGIAGEDDQAGIDTNDERYRVYEWLGYRLELLVHAADEVD